MKIQIATLIGILVVLSGVSVNAQTGPFACGTTTQIIEKDEFFGPVGGACVQNLLTGPNGLVPFLDQKSRTRCSCETFCVPAFFQTPKSSCRQPTRGDIIAYEAASVLPSFVISPAKLSALQIAATPHYQAVVQ